MKSFVLDVIAIAISFIIQDILGNYINLDNIVVDFLSFLFIFIIIYFIFSRLLKNKRSI
jgi:hypothetical protein